MSEGSGGVSMVVVAMGAMLGVVIGLLAGAGGTAAVLKSSPKMAASLGVAPDASAGKSAPQEKACPECPTCPKAPSSAGYALVYPIEETLRIEGKLDEQFLRERVIKSRLTLQKCYQTELDAKPSTKGEISLSFTVGSKGNVVAAVARHNTTKNAALETCLLDTVKAWDFQDRVKSAQATVKVDVLFTPLGAGQAP